MTDIQIAPLDQHNEEWISQAHPPDWQNPTANGRYNLLVIGGGSAGLVCAAGAVGVGAKVALVEKSYLGGDCLNVGCVPSKTILRTARAVGDIRRAAAFGVHVPGNVTVDFGAVMGRMRQVRANISHHDSAYRFRDLGIDVFLGDGQFTGADTFEIDGKTIHFKKAVIATGSRPAFIPIPGLAEAGYLTNESIFFQLTDLPPRLAVIGAGPIGAELAQAFRRFGSEVTLFDILPQVLGREDEEAAAVVQRALVEDGIDLRLGVTIKEVVKQGGDKVVRFVEAGVERETAVTDILLAVGRAPNVEGLNLEAAHVAYHKKGIQVNDHLQTTNTNIFAAGDVCLPYQFTHTADAAARIVVQNALFLGRKKFSDLTIPWVTYTDPEVAHVGLYPRDAAAQNIPIDTYTVYLKDTDRGRADGEEEGFAKVHVKKGTDKILGATIVGPHAGEMISEVTLAMVTGAGLGTLNQVIHPYPTQAEAIRKTADAWNRTRLTPTVAGLFDRWLTWTR
ncbi:MAG: mercuric reductase [Chloroflexota bacterium]|nr:mercuric reductase [Ardenticatenaceae bacterium]